LAILSTFFLTFRHEHISGLFPHQGVPPKHQQSSCQSVRCRRTPTPMILWCLRLLTCTRLIGP
uniref:Uncharacterized protein n=1 Tax=Aegilops tauschii subsp. strangulata TaxID=200361 RepID=A0A453HBM1_AEGTS